MVGRCAVVRRRGFFLALAFTAGAASGADNAAFVSYSGVPSRMEPGGTATVTVTMRNTGTTTWKRTVATETTRQSIRKTLSIFGLRAIGHDWGVRTVNVSGSAAPNALYRFQFTITAPEKPATYPFQRRMVRDTIIVDIPTVPASLDWGFGAVTPRKLIVVAKAPPPPPDTAPSFEGAPIPDQEWLVGQAIKSVTLPAATGGNGTLNYSFFGCRLPGGVRRSGRLIHGTPTAVKEVTCTWKVTDSDANRAESDTAKLTFKIIVRQPVLVLSKASLQVKENGSSDFTVKLGGAADGHGHGFVDERGRDGGGGADELGLHHDGLRRGADGHGDGQGRP